MLERPLQVTLPPPRRLVHGDIPWVIDLATRRMGEFDTIGAEGWLTTQVLMQHGVYLPIRTSGGFLIAILNAMPWNLAEMECAVMLLVTDEDEVWQAVHLLRASIHWARMRKARYWRYWWDHGDAAIMAKRVGAVPDTPRYRIDLCPQHHSTAHSEE